MADNKNSFVFYTDWIDTFKSLPKEDGYDLLMHMLAYVNDEDPTTDNVLVNAVFQNIKNSLKRDLKKYEARAEKSRKNGKLGGRPKNLEEPKEPSRLINNLTEPRKPDSVSDSDSDSVSDISNIDIETNLNLFSEDVPTPTKTKTKRKTKDKVKAESVTDEQFEKYKKFLELFNANFKGSNFRGRRVDVVDFMICLETYNELEILNAVRNHNQNFWIQDLTPQSLFRTTTRGGGVAADVIGQLLVHKQIKKHI